MLIFLSLFLILANSAPFPETQWKALCDLYNTFKEQDKVDWVCSEQSSGYCSWKGVSCDTAMGVTSLDTGYGGIVGDIPKSIGDLTQIESLTLSGWVSDEGISSIPDEIGNLKYLKTLAISNGAAESIPSSFSKLAEKMQSFSITYFPIKTFPDVIFKFTQLTALDLSGLPLENIPEEIGGLANLEEFTTYLSKYTSLPETFGKLDKLDGLYMTCSQLKSFPKSFGNLTNMKVLDLSCSKYYHPNWSNTLDTDFSFMSSMDIITTINLDSNNISAVLPDDLPKYLESFSCNDCQSLFGAIPDWISESFGTLNLENNQLSGVIPADICRSDLREELKCSVTGNTWLNCFSSFYNCCGIDCRGPE